MKPILLTFLLLGFFAASFYSINTISSKHTPLNVQTNQKLISMHHTEGDTFKVDLIVNTKHSMYVYEEAMVSHKLQSKDELLSLPIDLVKYAFTEHDEHFRISLTYAMTLEDASDRVHLEEAILVIGYDDNKHLFIPIGEFAYDFTKDDFSSLDYTASTPIKGDYGYGDSVVGQCIGLASQSDAPLTIKDITLFSSHVKPNMDYMVEVTGPVNPLMDLETILNTPYNPKNPSVAPKTLTLSPGEKTTVCLPFATTRHLSVDHYPIQVVYGDAAHDKTLVIDDFTYADIGLDGVPHESVMRDGIIE